MDVVSDVMTIGAISVTTFEYKQSTIIVFAQRDGENPRINSEVYEFKGNNIVRIQFLPTNKPISVHHYVHGDFNFILMINELEPSNVLCWDGQCASVLKISKTFYITLIKISYFRSRIIGLVYSS